MPSELSTGKTVFILAVVVGCFAILWPKVFYPMLTAPSIKPVSKKAPHWLHPSNVQFLDQLCFLLEESHDPIQGLVRWSDNECFDEIKNSCMIELTEKILEGFRLSDDNSNLTECLRQLFGLTVDTVSAAAPPIMRTTHYQPQPKAVIHPHARAERPSHLHKDQIHPALREKGRAMPQRTIDKEARPGPMPGIRPPLGGGGHMVPPQSKGSGAMGIIMPLYTFGIIIFFLYTIMKVLSKKSCEEEKDLKLNELSTESESKKYIFDEEYLDSSNSSHREKLRRQERETSRQRRRQEVITPDSKIDSIGVSKDGKSVEDEQMDHLRRRLEETERAMERLMSQMGSVTDKLTAAKITEVLTQAQAQAKFLKAEEAALLASKEKRMTTTESTDKDTGDENVPKASDSIITPELSTNFKENVQNLMTEGTKVEEICSSEALEAE